MFLRTLFLFCAVSLAARAQDEPRPNLIVVFTDDQGYADVGVFGARDFVTPNLDRLAAEGTRFTDFYVAQPVCTASRVALLTGCYPNRLGLHGALGPQSPEGIADSELTLAEVCRARGYRTAAFGKWHLGCHPPFLPLQHGFDEFHGIPYSNDMWPYHPESPAAWGDLPLYEGNEVVGHNPDQNRFTATFTARAVQFIRQSAAAQQPFFVYLAYPMPHAPLHAGPGMRGHSARGLYGDVIEDIDAGVGRLLDVVQELGLDANTWMVFTSDNGPWLSYGDHAGDPGPLREGKGTTFEGGVRVPCLMRWPGVIPAGRVCAEPLMTLDLLPTVAALLDVPLPAHPIDGLDVGAVLRGEPGASSPHEALYFYYHQGDLEAMRSGPWKLHFPHAYRTMDGQEPGRGGIPGTYVMRRTGLELYDLHRDPGERHDVAAAHPDVVHRLQALADEARRRLGDRLTGVRGAELREPGRVERPDR